MFAADDVCGVPKDLDAAPAGVGRACAPELDDEQVGGALMKPLADDVAAATSLEAGLSPDTLASREALAAFATVDAKRGDDAPGWPADAVSFARSTA